MTSGGSIIETMLGTLADVIIRHPRRALALPVLFCLILTPFALQATQRVVPEGWLPTNSESSRTERLTRSEFGRSSTTYYVVFSDPTGRLAVDDREFHLAVERAVRPFRAMPEVASVITHGSTRNPTVDAMLRSHNGSMSLAVITLREAPMGYVGSSDWLHANLRTDPLSAHVTGLLAVGHDFRTIARGDLIRAELISIPITAFVLFAIFRGLVPTLLPVLLAIGSVIIALAITDLLASFMLVNVFAINAVTMLALAVGIDYALIMTSRFREEVGRRSPADALRETMVHAGHAIIVAGTTVAIGLTGLMLFRVPAAVSTGLIGASVVLAAVLIALTALPAAMYLTWPRFVSSGRTRLPGPTGVFRRADRIRQQHPFWTVLICVGVLALLTWPITHLHGSSPGIEDLPQGSESRQAAEMIAGNFPNATTAPVDIVLQARSVSMFDASNLTTYQSLVQSLKDDPRVTRVESIWSLLPSAFGPSTLSASLLLQPDLVTAVRPFLSPNAAYISLTLRPDLSLTDQQRFVAELRERLMSQPLPGMQALVGGSIGQDIDLRAHTEARILPVAVWIIGMTAVALYVQLRSVVLPLKAILLNLASIGASFGALVWLFQDGHLAGLLGVEATGTTVLLVPVLMFCLLFGLSMDFEVIMLSRIREQYLAHGDHVRAISEGLAKTATIVTASAVLLSTVFLGFALSTLDVAKALGIGLTIAVIIDATIVRMLLLPATMHLMGRWNWWPADRDGARRP